MRATRTTTTVSGLAVAALFATVPSAGVDAQSANAKPGRPCNASWESVPIPPTSEREATLTSVTALSRQDAWFSGRRASSVPWILRWDGTAVGEGPQLPDRPKGTYAITSNSFSSPTEGWLKTSRYDNNYLASPTVHHWHDGRWTMVPLAASPNPRTHWALVDSLAPVSSDDAWAVGWYTELHGEAQDGALIEHWDGSQWSIVPNPANDEPGAYLQAITVLSPTDIWAAGGRRDDTGTTVPLIEHWDGSQWSVIPTPSGAAPAAIYALDASGADDIWAVGAQTQEGTGNVDDVQGLTRAGG